MAEKNIPNCAGFSFGFKAHGRRIVNYVTVIAAQKLDDKDKQAGIFFDRNRLRGGAPIVAPARRDGGKNKDCRAVCKSRLALPNCVENVLKMLIYSI